MDYKAIAKAITDPENQPHQWNDQELADFFVTAADEVERLRKSLLSAKECINDKAYTAAVMVIDTALQQKESE